MMCGDAWKREEMRGNVEDTVGDAWKRGGHCIGVEMRGNVEDTVELSVETRGNVEDTVSGKGRGTILT